MVRLGGVPGLVAFEVHRDNGASLAGFTWTNGAADSGGGVFGESEAAVTTNCVLTGNSAWKGGGAHGGALNTCTLAGNSAYWGGGACDATLNNCIVYYNTGQGEANYRPQCLRPRPHGLRRQPAHCQWHRGRWFLRPVCAVGRE